MLDRAYRLSSTWELFNIECQKLKLMFSKLKYPEDLVNSTISSFVDSKLSDETNPSLVTDADKTIRIVLPFKDQKSADVLRK